jgi:hypothetical protein
MIWRDLRVYIPGYKNCTPSLLLVSLHQLSLSPCLAKYPRGRHMSLGELIKSEETRPVTWLVCPGTIPSASTWNLMFVLSR